MPGLAVIRAHADTLEEDGKRAVYEDVAVFSEEWTSISGMRDPPTKAWAAL